MAKVPHPPPDQAARSVRGKPADQELAAAEATVLGLDDATPVTTKTMGRRSMRQGQQDGNSVRRRCRYPSLSMIRSLYPASCRSKRSSRFLLLAKALHFEEALVSPNGHA
jgi:hypothetical protein